MNNLKERPILETGIFPRLMECQKCGKLPGPKDLQISLSVVESRLPEEDYFTGVVYDLKCLPQEMQDAVTEALKEAEYEPDFEAMEQGSVHTGPVAQR